MADQDVKESHEKTVNLETLWRWKYLNIFLQYLNIFDILF